MTQKYQKDRNRPSARFWKVSLFGLMGHSVARGTSTTQQGPFMYVCVVRPPCSM